MTTLTGRFALLTVAFVAACGSAEDSEGAEGDSGGSVPMEKSGGDCVGDAVKAYELRDNMSCTSQGGLWSSDTVSCLGDGHTCAYPGTFTDQSGARDDCLDIIGCRWRNDDGSEEVPELLSGACEGEAIECHDFAREDECNKQRGCRFSGGSCERRNSLFWEKNAACAELSNAMHALELNPEVARSSCLQSYGCRWVHEDGREELAHDGDMPAIRPDAAPPPG